MKNYTKKTGVILTSLIILCSLLFISCPNLFVPGSSAGGSSPSGLGSAPSGTGMGTLSLSVTIDSRSRTILPDFSSTTLNTYRLFFTGKPGVSSDQEIDINSYSALSSFEVPAGVYTSLRVYAYTNTANRGASGSVGKYAAWGTLTKEIDLSGSQTISDSITLSPAEPVAGGKGTFIYDITFPNGLTNVKMELTRVGGSTTTKHFVISSAPQVDADDGKMELDPGQYRLRFTLERPNTQTVIWREVLHVYQNMESKYEYEFEEDHFRKLSYTVTFDFNDSVREPLEISYFYDSFTSESGKNPANPTRDGHVFDGWHKNAAGTDPWVFGSNLTGPLTLYAKWIPLFPGGSVTISIVGGEDDYQVGITLQANYTPAHSPIVPTPVIQYQWNRNGVPISGATGQEYLVVAANSGARLTVTVSYVGYEGSVTSLQTPAILGARGTSWENPFIVNSITTLRMVGTGESATGGIWSKDAYYLQTANITVGGSAWTPVSKRGDELPFEGKYNGNGYFINNINWTSDSHFHDDLSIFGIIGEDGVVENIMADGPRITGKDRLGVIASVNHGTIRRSVAYTINVNGKDSIGGIAGENFGIIENCYTTGVIFGHGGANEGNKVGGIAGFNASTGTVQMCYSTAAITGDNYVGGIVGQNDGKVDHCIALNPNITSRTAYAGRVGAGAGTFTNNQTRNDSAAFSIRITGETPTPNGHRGTDRNTGVALTTIFNAANGWTTGETGNWVFPTTPVNLTLNQALPSLRMPTPRPSPVPVPTLPDVRQRTAPNTATLNIDVRNFITFDRLGREGWYAKELQGHWVLGEMVEGAPSGPVAIPPSIISNINSLSIHQLASNTTGQTYTIRHQDTDVLIGTLRLWGSGQNNHSVNFTMTFAIPVKNAEVVFTCTNSGTLFQPSAPHPRQEYLCSRDGIIKTGWIFRLTSGNVISGALHGPNTASSVSGGMQHYSQQGTPHTAFTMFVETYEDWTYLPDHEETVTEPYVIFKVSDEEFYWFDEENNQGQSNSMGATNLFTSFTPNGSNYTAGWVPKTIGDFTKDGNASIPIEGSLFVRTYRGADGATFYPSPGGLDRDEDGSIYTAPRRASRPEVGRSNASRMTQNIVLNTGEIVGTAEIILIEANTVVSGSTYNFSTGTSNPVEIEVILHLNEDFRHDLRADTPVRLRSIPNGAISTIRGIGTIIRTADTDGSPNFTMVVPFNAGNYSVGFVNTSGTAADISRFHRLANNTGNLVFQFNY